MQVTYTNRKGRTYYLCQGVTRTGKPRYYFAREPKGKPVEQIPEGYEIRESVNGIVSLAKKRPVQVLPEERAAVEAAIHGHPKARNYRIDVKGKQITVYELVGPGADDLLASLSQHGLGPVLPNLAERFRAEREQYGQFTPVMRFTLLDKEKRTFYTERWCYLGSIDDWIYIGPSGPVHLLAQRFIPKLGTDALYEVY